MCRKHAKNAKNGGLQNGYRVRKDYLKRGGMGVIIGQKMQILRLLSLKIKVWRSSGNKRIIPTGLQVLENPWKQRDLGHFVF